MSKTIEFTFKSLEFEVINGSVIMNSFTPFLKKSSKTDTSFCYFPEFRITGDNNLNRFSSQQFGALGRKLKYLGHEYQTNAITIMQGDEDILVTTTFESYDDTNAIRTHSTIKNVSHKSITFEYISALNFYGIGQMVDTVDMSIYRFYSSNYNECQPKKFKMKDLGFSEGIRSAKRIRGVNVGSWSTKEELPQAILSYNKDKHFLMFQVESNNGWFWEIGEHFGNIFLNAGIGNSVHNDWYKKLEPNEQYQTINCAFWTGNSINDVIEKGTKYKRNVIRKCEPDTQLPVIFNEYMHLSWDSPEQTRTEALVPAIANFGVDYYVIDCGWHNEEPGDQIYPYVGQWKESKKRYPDGIKHIIDYIHSHGMKAGLWIEPEIVGRLCDEMIKYYPKDAFITVKGKQLLTANRYFLDFRHEMVRQYLDKIIDYLVICGVDYIKMDYNQDMGPGTDYLSDSLGDGLEKNAHAYYLWVSKIMDKYPHLIIETCSSGGHRMDYKTMSLFPIVSTSDQIDYLKYPYIAANILSSILPEQAAVWSYPVAAFDGIHEKTDEIDSKVGEETVIMNMINSFLGRMHLASYINHLNNNKQDLIKEGILYYKHLSTFKRMAIPYFPKGFWSYQDKELYSGFIHHQTIYLAVWNLSHKKQISIPIHDYDIVDAVISYPKQSNSDISYHSNCVNLTLDKKQSRFLEIKVKHKN